MRSEKQMLELVLNAAAEDERIRAVTLEGSRTNPNVPKDLFQDFDISYHVTEMKSFQDNPGWVDKFGARLIMQTPEDMSMFPPELGKRFSYMMLFTDGNRIDLTLIPIEEKEAYCQEDKLMMVLLDKDGVFPEIPPPTDVDYWVKRPSPEFFADCCNEFWWVSTYVAKGLWRNEILYALDHLNNYVRPMLMKMLEWHAGIRTDFSLSVGKNAKYLKQYISMERWEQLMSTYPNGTYEEVWRSLFVMGDLFRVTAEEVASCLNFEYPHDEDRNVTAFLQRVREMEPSASTIF